MWVENVIKIKFKLDDMKLKYMIKVTIQMRGIMPTKRFSAGINYNDWSVLTSKLRSEDKEFAEIKV